MNKLEAYWTNAKAAWAPTTYKSELSRFNKLRSLGFPKIMPALLFVQLKKDNYKPYTRKQMFIRAGQIERKVYGSTKYQQWLKDHPEAFRGVYLGRNRKLSKDDVRRIRITVSGHYPRVNNFIVLVTRAALRKQEALNLRWSDIDPKSQRLIVRQGKGKKDREVPFLSRYIGELSANDSAYVCAVGSTRTLRPEYSLKRVIDKTGIRFSPHDLRAYCLQQLSEEFSLHELKAFAGHASFKTTLRYLITEHKDLLHKMRRIQ